MSGRRSLVIGIYGPTACRKSELAMQAARQFGAEIINCDSVQVYSKIQIGANKPSALELSLVKHHLVGFVHPPDVYTAGQFHRDFRRIIEEPKIYLLTGGSGFYAQAAVKGLFPVGASEDRLNLTKEWDEVGGAALFGELEALDKEYAEKIGSTDKKRILRGLEILRNHPGATMKKLEDTLLNSPRNFDFVGMVLHREREDLRSHIRLRTQKMYDQKLLAETQMLLNSGLRDWTPMKSVGYAECVKCLDGRLAEKQLVEEISKNTSRLAKRQLTWLRRDLELKWFLAEQEWDNALMFMANVLNNR